MNVLVHNVKLSSSDNFNFLSTETREMFADWLKQVLIKLRSLFDLRSLLRHFNKKTF